MERQGTLIRNVESGHFRDMMEDVAIISLSWAFVITNSHILAL